MPGGDRVDPAVGLDHPLVALGGVGGEHVAVDERLGELGLQRRQQPHLPGDVGRGIDDVVGAAEVGEALAHVAEIGLGLVELLAGEADRIVARLLGEVVHQRARLREDRLDDRMGILGGEGAWPARG